MGATVITLIKQTYKTDSIGQQVPDKLVRTEVFATEASVNRSEWFAAQNAGMSCEYVFQTPSVNYSGEKLAEFEGRRYQIYRAYNRGDITELYLGQRGGLNG